VEATLPSTVDPAEWESKMELRESRNIVKTLAQGVHPITGEVFPPESPYNDPKVIRALFSILELAKKPRKSVEERRRENRELGRPTNAGLPWSENDRTHIAEEFRGGKTIEELANALERSRGAIHAELIRQGLVEPESQ
jgi:hypothetical protein